VRTAIELARTPVGELLLVDRDTVQPSNLNRQLPALSDTLGRPKAEVVAERLHKINPELIVDAIHDELRLDNAAVFLGEHRFDYVVDTLGQHIHIGRRSPGASGHLVQGHGSIRSFMR